MICGFEHCDLQEAVISLLLAGAHPALTDIRGYDVMIDAAQGGHQEILNVLRLAGARTNTSKATQVSQHEVMQQATVIPFICPSKSLQHVAQCESQPVLTLGPPLTRRLLFSHVQTLLCLFCEMAAGIKPC